MQQSVSLHCGVLWLKLQVLSKGSLSRPYLDGKATQQGTGHLHTRCPPEVTQSIIVCQSLLETHQLLVRQNRQPLGSPRE